MSEALDGEQITSEWVILLESENERYVLLYTAGQDLRELSDAFRGSHLNVYAEFKDLMAPALDMNRASVQEVLFVWP